MIFFNFKNITTILTFTICLSSFSLTVYSDSILKKKCNYYCNITGKKYKGNTIYKNIEGYTLNDHVKRLGAEYKYYALCCDGRLTSRDHVDVVTNEFKILSDVNINMKGSYEFMDYEKSCSSYCAINIDNRKAYIKDSEDLSLLKFAKKYGNEYDLFTYCCDGKLDSDRMTLTSTLEEFSLNASYFTLQQKENTNDFLNSSCSYYCNIKNDKIISISGNSNKQKISDYAKAMKDRSDDYDSFTKCCDGKMKDRKKASVISISGKVTNNKKLKSLYNFSYMDLTRKCNYYCGFNEENKTISFINTSDNLINAAKAYKKSFKYFTYCCERESSIRNRGSVVVVSSNGEESGLDSSVYTIKSVVISKNSTRVGSSKSIEEKKTTNKKTTTLSSAQTNSTKNNNTSENWKCGTEHGRCPEGYCCSKFNYCGKTAEYCTSGCQPQYGLCE